MKRCTTIVLATAAALLLIGASSALAAAPGLSFTEAKHNEPTYNRGGDIVALPLDRGDEFVSYAVKLKNSGTEVTSGSTSLAVSLPAGLTFAYGAGSFWHCHVAVSTCVNSEAVAPGAEFTPLTIGVWIDPAQAPDTVTAHFDAFGGGAALDVFAEDSFSFGPERHLEADALEARAEDETGADYTLAGGHPFSATSSFSIPVHSSPIAPTLGELNSGVNPVESLRDFLFELPAGFAGNPRAATGICTVAEVSLNECPDSAAVGGVYAETAGGGSNDGPLFRVYPEEGYAAAFATKPVQISSLVYVLRARLRSNGDYGVDAVAPLPPQSPALIGLKYAKLCGFGAKVSQAVLGRRFQGCRKPGEIGSSATPFISNGTRCSGEAPATRLDIDSYQNPGATDSEGRPDLSDPNWKTATVTSPKLTGCEALTEAWVGKGANPSEPSFGFQPDTGQAAAPASYSAKVHIPQKGLVTQTGRATAHLDDTTVELPRGLVLNPSAATGLGACSEAQVGYLGNEFPAPNPIHFRSDAEGCPDDSKVGTVEVRTPLLDKPVFGSVYLAQQEANPFGSKFAIYLVVDDAETGTHAALAGRVDPSQSDGGQIATTFTDNPQLPLEDIELNFFGGPRAPLANPDVCGLYTVNTELTPWSASDPDHPAGSEIAHPTDVIGIGSAPSGASTCPHSKSERPFSLGFSAGTTDLTAGKHSPFVLNLTRPDGNQELSQVSVTTPPGFAATLKGVSTCPWANVEAAANRARGAAEIADPSCPASSQVGTTTIGAGAGADPIYVKTGHAYLTGPYKGAPLSLTFIVPAVAGPFDLGVQVVKTALQVDQKTAQITAKSDPIPQILDGVPLQIRDIRINVDREAFALNPTNCEPMQVTAQVAGNSGATADLSNRFQVGDCAALGFHPNLKLQLHGGTKRGKYQRLEATVTYPAGNYANIARAAVTLPHSEFLAQEHIRTVCTRVQFAAKACPAGSVYGRATAITPLLDQPLSGPVYLRSSDNPLPDLVAALRGPDSMPIEVELAGRTDSAHGGIRNTFDLVPDTPVSKITLRLQGGKKSLIVNSRNLCAGTQRATVRLAGQNGKTHNFRPVVGNDCGKKPKKHHNDSHKRLSSIASVVAW